MPTRKSATKKSRTAPKKSSKRSAASVAGVYTTPNGNVAMQVPPFWNFRQTNDDLQMASPSGDVSLIVNAYERNGQRKLDARDYLDKLLASAPKESRVKRDAATARRAAARYKDTDGTAWYVEFITNGKVLLLAEISSPTTLATPEAKTALGVMDSLKIR